MRTLQARVRLYEKLRERGTAEGRKAWETACAGFRARYDSLAFPGGYESGLSRIQQGDANAVEAALVFLELRPYVFRAQYIRTKLTRLLKHALLTRDQAKRFTHAQQSAAAAAERRR